MFCPSPYCLCLVLLLACVEVAGMNESNEWSQLATTVLLFLGLGAFSVIVLFAAGCITGGLSTIAYKRHQRRRAAECDCGKADADREDRV